MESSSEKIGKQSCNFAVAAELALLFVMLLLPLGTGHAQPQFVVQSGADFRPPDIDPDCQHPQMAFGNGVWRCCWDGSRFEETGAAAGDGGILYSRSIDSGARWSRCFAIKYRSEDRARSSFSPQIATDGKGHWVLVFVSRIAAPGPNEKPDFDIYFSTSSNDGITWSAPAVLNSDANIVQRNDVACKVAMDPSGHCVAVWQNNEGSWCSTSSSHGILWSVARKLGDNRCTSPDIATNDYGRWIVCMSASAQSLIRGFTGDDTDIVIRASDNNGATWGRMQIVDPDACIPEEFNDDIHPRIMYDCLNRWAIIWESKEVDAASAGKNTYYGLDPDIMLSRSMDNGNTWSTVIPVNTNAASDARYDCAPSIASDRNGRWIAVWRSQANGMNDLRAGINADILASESWDFGATWTAPQILSSLEVYITINEIPAWQPGLATDGQGHWACAWYSRNSRRRHDIRFATYAESRPRFSPAPSNTPTFTETPTPLATATPTPTGTPSPTFTATPTQISKPTPAVTATSTPTPGPTAISTTTPLPTVAPSPSATPTPTQAATIPPTAIPTETQAPTPTNTPAPTATASPAPTATATPVVVQPTEVPTPTGIPTATETPTIVPTETFTAIPTATGTPTPIPTETSTPVPTETPAPTATEIPTLVPTEVIEPTATPVPTQQPEPTPMPSDTPVANG